MCICKESHVCIWMIGVFSLNIIGSVILGYFTSVFVSVLVAIGATLFSSILAACIHDILKGRRLAQIHAEEHRLMQLQTQHMRVPPPTSPSSIVVPVQEPDPKKKTDVVVMIQHPDGTLHLSLNIHGEDDSMKIAAQARSM